MTTTHDTGETGGPEGPPGDGLVEWLRAAGTTERLSDLERPQVADLGCGTGRWTIALGERFPAAAVVGLDPDLAAAEEARANVARAGRAAQIAIRRCDAADLAGGPYDLVTVLHLLGVAADPAAVLTAARRNLAPEGEVLVADRTPVWELAEAAGFGAVTELAVDSAPLHVLVLRSPVSGASSLPTRMPG